MAVRPWTRRIVIWGASLAALAVATAAMLAVRGALDKAHVALVFVVVVLAGSAAGGRVLGIALAALAFLAFDYLFVPPYSTLRVENPLDWLVLAAFLVTSIVAAQLLARAQARAEEARQRAIEVERLAVLGAETLNAGRAEDALAAIATVIRSTLAVACCEVLLGRGQPPAFVPVAQSGTCERGPLDLASLTAWVAQEGVSAEEHGDRTVRVGAGHAGAARGGWGAAVWQTAPDTRAVLLPLRVRDRTVGVLRIADTAPIALDPAQRQFLDALAYYAALGAERVRLVAEAERAEALRQADELKDALIAGVSHDLRTPLTLIKALAHRLAERGVGDAASIEEEADRLNRFVADLLDLSRLNGGGMPMRIELNAADDLLGALARRVRASLGTRRLVMPGDARGGGPLLFGRFDFVQSLRVLVNLVENAHKYSPPLEPIELGVRREGDRLLFSVADRGPGIPDGERERVFEPFYRAPGAPADVGGAGLGLTIARRLAEAEQGSVDFVARTGGGSVFTLSVPAADAPAIE